MTPPPVCWLTLLAARRPGKQCGMTVRGSKWAPASENVTNLLSVRLSPDGSRLATEAGDANSDIWIYDRKRQVNTCLTFGLGGNSSPVWSPDGEWIAYVGTRKDGTRKDNLYRKPSNGGKRTLVTVLLSVHEQVMWTLRQRR